MIHESPSPAPRPAGRVPFLQRRVTDPLRKVLGQGHTPEKLALSLAFGVAIGLFPIFGTTTLLCIVAGVVLRLNHPALQVANQLMYPLQVPLILVFVRFGEFLVSRLAVAAVPVATASASADPWTVLARFGTAGLHGILGWAVVAPAVGGLAYLVILPVVRLALRRRAPASASA